MALDSSGFVTTGMVEETGRGVNSGRWGSKLTGDAYDFVPVANWRQ